MFFRKKLNRKGINRIARAIALGAVVYGRHVSTDTEFANWRVEFEMWRDDIWGFVRETLGQEVVDLYQTIGMVEIPGNWEIPGLDWRPWHDGHRRLLSIIATYIDRLRYIVEKYSA